MAEYWFKRHRYGYGWTPATWQGWASVLGTLAVVIATATVLPAIAPRDAWWPAVIVLAVSLVGVIVLVLVSITHGPAPRWRWGRRSDDDPAEDL